MLKALLRSGDIKDYTVLGQEGITVHSVASQLRNTIKLKRGQVFADYLAIPKRNDRGNQIDWYVPFDSDNDDGQYIIIPWTSATDAEREKALIELQIFEREMLALGREVGDAKDLKGDQRLFSRLLCGGDPNQLNDENNLTALRFPNAEHVYIVNDRPVVTFWGFSEKHIPIHGSPFLPLQPAKPDVVEPPTTRLPVTENTPWYKRFWWLLPLLLLLLLLLLLPLLLRSCLPTSTVAPTLPSVIPEKNVPERIVDGIPYHYENGHWHRPNGDVISDTDLLDHLNGIDDKTTPDMPAEPEATAPNPADMNTDNADDRKADELPTAQNEQSVDETPKTEAVEDNPPAKPPVEPTDNAVDNAVNHAPNTPLNIPQSSHQNGNVDFLNGRWKAGAGIQDKTTGKPLQLNYEFSKGQGKVEIARGDGIRCTGDVTAAMTNGQLNINNTQTAQCSDGSTYQLPNVNCQAGDKNRADCQGEYGEGQKFPMSMKSN